VLIVQLTPAAIGCGNAKGELSMPKASRKTKTAKPGEYVCAHRGAVFGIVLEVVKDKKLGTRYKIGSDDTAFFISHKDLSAPRRGNFEDLVRLYDSLVRLFDRMAGLAGEAGHNVRANVFEFMTETVLTLSAHKKPDLLVSRRVLLDFGRRAGFDEEKMAEGRAMFGCAA
jgi:hypothetical protein